MPQRFLRPGLTNSSHWNRVSFPAQSLFVRLLTLVDDFGRYDARPALVRSHAFPVSEDVEKSHVESMLDELANEELIIVYQVDGKEYLQVERWVERARGASKYPPPPGAIDESQPRGLIYFVRSEVSRKIKIGFTQWKIESRLGHLQTGSSEKLSLIGTMAGTIADERALHRRFYLQNAGGEWFLDSDELSDFATNCAATSVVCAPLPAVARECCPPSPVAIASSHESSPQPFVPEAAPPPDGDGKTAAFSDGKPNLRLPTTPQSQRMAAIMHRRHSTPWSEDEYRSYRKLGIIPDEDLAAVERYYAANWPPRTGANILRHDMLTLLNNWNGEVTRAHSAEHANGNGNGSGADPDGWREWLASLPQEIAYHPFQFANPPFLKDDFKTFQKTR